MIPRFRYYLFDVDGTLLDSATDITAAAREVIMARGREAPQEEFLRGQIGRHLIGTFRTVFPDYSQEDLDRLIDDYRRVYRARNHRSTSVFPGAREALAALDGKKATATTKASI